MVKNETLIFNEIPTGVPKPGQVSHSYKSGLCTARRLPRTI